MGKHSQQLNTGLTEQERIEHSIQEKAQREEEERLREAEQWKQLLEVMAKNRKARAEFEESARAKGWVKIE